MEKNLVEIQKKYAEDDSLSSDKEAVSASNINASMSRSMKHFKVVFVFLLLFFVCFLLLFFARNEQGLFRLNAQEPHAVYKLFKTMNMWNFLKLDTVRGFIWQVQFSVDENDRFTSVLSYIDLLGDREPVPERFTLYPTENIYAFILLDQLDGRVWQIQWSFDPDKRFVIPIE